MGFIATQPCRSRMLTENNRVLCRNIGSDTLVPRKMPLSPSLPVPILFPYIPPCFSLSLYIYICLYVSASISPPIYISKYSPEYPADEGPTAQTEAPRKSAMTRPPPTASKFLVQTNLKCSGYGAFTTVRFHQSKSSPGFWMTASRRICPFQSRTLTGNSG